MLSWRVKPRAAVSTGSDDIAITNTLVPVNDDAVNAILFVMRNIDWDK